MTGPYDGSPPDEPQEETAQVVAPDFARRRLRARLRRWRPFLITGFVVLLAAVGGWFLYFSSALAVSGVDVTGNTTVSAARIEKVAAVPMGEQLVKVDLGAIAARVETIPAVRSASVSRSWPSSISIEVVERVPVAVVSRGTIFAKLDAKGILFGRYAHAPAGLPLVKTTPNVTVAALAEAATVVSVLRPDIAARVDFVNVATVDKISLEMKGGILVQWGSAEGSENKAKVLEILLKKKVSEIDVSVPGRPTTR